MAQSQGSSLWRWIRLTAFFAFVIMILVIVGVRIYLNHLPRPSAEKIATTEQNYRRVRALFPENTSTTLSSTPPVLPHSATTTESLQARCDRLFIEISQIKYDFLSGDHYPRIGQEDVDRARALAALYDSGVRVSPEARRGYRLTSDGVVVEFLARSIFLDFKPEGREHPITERIFQTRSKMLDDDRAGQFARYVEALKFLRVVNCPVSGQSLSGANNDFIRGPLKKLDGYSLGPLPPDLENFDVELLAPRGRLDWDACVALELDRDRDEAAAFEKLMHAGNVYRFTKNQIDNDFPDTWYKPVQSNLVGIGCAIVLPSLSAAPKLESRLGAEKGMQDYAAALKRNNLTQETVAGAHVLEYQNDQIIARAEAAAIELRRGAKLPSPGDIGPDSYLFDPVTQRPYMFTQETVSPGVVKVSIRRPLTRILMNPNDKKVIEGIEVISVCLPANHPGLANVPKMD